MPDETRPVGTHPIYVLLAAGAIPSVVFSPDTFTRREACSSPIFRCRSSITFCASAAAGAVLSAKFGVHPTMISNWKQELVKRAGEWFARGSTLARLLQGSQSAANSA